jgi:PAS domain S-box-containing protein
MDEQAMHILLVEDEQAHAELIQRSFDQEPHAEQVQLTVVGSLEEARSAVAESTPDLIIADWLLPDGKGTELLPGDGEEPSCAVVMMTSHGDEQIAVEVLRAGALDYVVKSPESFFDMPRIAWRALREWGHIIERRRAEDAVRRRAEELAALQATVLDITRTRDLPTLLETIVERAARLLKAPIGGLYLVEPDQEQTRCVVSHNTPCDYRGTTLKYGEGAAGTVAQTGKPLNIDDYGTWDRRAAIYEQDRPFGAVLAVPMMWQDQVVGVIDTVHYADGQRFTQEDVELLTLLANHATIAVENARLYEQAQEELRERKRLEQKTEERWLHLESVLNHAPDAIITMDAQHLVSEWNPGAERLFGYSLQEAIGRNLDELIASHDGKMLDEATGLTRQVLGGKVVPPTEAIRFRKDGNPVPVILSASPIAIRERLVGIVAMYTDLSELRQAEASIRELRELNESIVQNSSEGITARDTKGRFALVNPAAASLLGYAPEELLGQDWTVIIPPDQQAAVQAADERRARGESDRYEIELLRKDGTRFPALISESSLFDSDHKLVSGTLAILTDISDRVRAEETLARRAQEMAALYEISLEINSQPDLPTLLHTIIQSASKLVGTRMGGLYLVRPDREVLELLVGHGILRDFLGTTLRMGEGLSGRVAQAQEPLVVTDYRSWEGSADVYAGQDFRRVLAVPLKVGEDVIGVINVADDEQVGSFEEDEIRLVSLFADQAAIAIQNARLFEAEARQRREAETIQAATQALTATLDLQQVFELILSELRQVVPYDSASVQQLRGGQLEIIGGHGFPNLRDLLGVSFDLADGDNPNQLVVDSRNTVILDDAPARYHDFRREPHAQAGIRSWLGVPLLFADRLIGMLALDKREPCFYTEGHARLASTFAAQAAIAIENARLFRAEHTAREQAEANAAQLRTRERHLMLLTDITRAALETPDLPTLLQRFADRLGESLDADGCYITLWDRDRRVTIPAAAYGPMRDGFSGIRVKPGETTVTESVLRAGHPLVIEDLSATPYTTQHLASQFPSRSMLALPLVTGNEKLGAAHIAFHTTHHFSPDEISRAEQAAGQIALAIAKAQLLKTEREQRELAEALREAGRAISTSLELNETLRLILEQLKRVLVYDTASVLILREEDMPDLVVGVGYSDEETTSTEAGQLLQDSRILGQMVHDLQPVVSGDVQRLDGWTWVPGAEHVRSWMGIPLIAQDRMIGALMVDHSQPGFFGDKELQTAQALARHAAQAIDNARLFQAERQQRELAEALRRAAAAVGSTLDLEQILDHILEQVDRVIPSDAVNVSLIEGDRSRIVRWRGYEQFGREVHRVSLHLADTPSLRRMRELAEPVTISDTTTDAGWLGVPEVAWVRSYAGAPIRVRDRVIGFLNVDSATPGFFSQADADRLQAFADQAGLAIGNAWLYEETSLRAEHMVTLNRIGLALTSDLNLDEVLRTLYEQISQIMDTGSFYVALYNEESGFVHFPLITGVDGEGKLEPMDIRDTRGITGHVIESGKPLYLPDTQALPEGATYEPVPLKAQPARSHVGVPLIFREKVIGVLSVQSYEPDAYSESDITLLATIAAHATTAIENARLFRTVEQGKRDWEVTFDTMQDAIALVDREQRIQRANEAFANLVQAGYSRIIGRSCRAVLDGLVCTGDVCLLDQPTELLQPGSCTYEYRGQILEIQATPISEGDVGEPESIAHEIYVIRDVTERQRAEDEIRKRNRELALINRVIAASAASQEIGPILETVCRELSLALSIPHSTASLLNETNTELSVVAEHRPEDRPSLLGERIELPEQIRHLYLSRKTPLALENIQADPLLTPIHRLARQRGALSILVLPLLIDGEVAGSLTLSHTEPSTFPAEQIDLAQRVAHQVSGALARARLAEMQRQLSAAVEQAAEAIAITDIDGTLLYVNPAFEQLIGYSRAEVIGHSPRVLRNRVRDTRIHQELWRAVSDGQVWQERFEDTRRDGQAYTLDLTVAPVRNQAAEIVNFVATMRDMTRELQLEEQFRQSQKMEALGRLAGGIAHDFNNLLTVIHLSTRLLQRQLRSEDPIWEHVQRIQETSDRAAKLTKQLLSFSRREVIEPRLLNLSQVVRDLSRMLQRIIGEDITMKTTLAGDLWPLKVDPTQLDQVLMNLVVNARDAMPEGGTLTIETSNVSLDDTYATQHVDAQPGDHVLLVISDTGVGIDEDTRAHLFEPFFTTKERGEGTGLGLSTVFGIVRQSGGHIQVLSQPGQGTTFRIYLPRAEGTVDTVVPPLRTPLSDDLLCGTETVLVAEDETAVRDLAVSVLKSCGYQVLAARSGPEALRIGKEHEGPIHMLIADMVMPQMSGRELVERFLLTRPDTCILYISGYANQEITHEGVLAPGTNFLPKPFTVEELTRKVRETLDDRG